MDERALIVATPPAEPGWQPSRRATRYRAKRLWIEERGTAVVEFALVGPLLFLLVLGILDFGRALNYYNTLTQLAGQGARAASVNRNPDGTALSNANLYSIQQQLATTYTSATELKNGIVVCIMKTPTGGPGDDVTVKTSFKFMFLPFIGQTIGHLTGLTLSSTQTERAETANVDVNGNPTYATGNQNGNNTGC